MSTSATSSAPLKEMPTSGENSCRASARMSCGSRAAYSAAVAARLDKSKGISLTVTHFGSENRMVGSSDFSLLTFLDFDLIVIGSGFGGAMAALPAVRAGKRVLMIERGDR